MPRRITSELAQWRADTQTGAGLQFVRCKGGFFSTKDEFALRVIGRTAQDGTQTRCVTQGTQVTVCGKNLLAYPFSETTRTHNGVTFTDNGDGTVTANGTATAMAVFTFMAENPARRFAAAHMGETLTFSGCPSGGATSTYTINAQGFITDGIGIYEWGNGATITIANAAGTIQTYIIVRPGVTVSNVVFRPMIERGTQKTAWEPYAGQTIATPCDLYEGDVWYPMTGVVERRSGGAVSIERYAPQPVFAPQGLVNVQSSPTGLAPGLSATMLVRR